MQNGFCVILSKYRLYQGITLYRSLAYNYRNFKMFILCVDDESYEICSKLHLENVVLLKAEDLKNKKFAALKQSRRLNEYCWTLKPFFLKHVMKEYNFVKHIVYLDADICFFNDPSPIFNSQRDYSILLSEHDFLEKDKGVAQVCGKYNSGLIVFKRCEASMSALKWWSEKCMEWCSDSLEEGRFGDQKYLDLMPRLFSGVRSITTPGVNIAPWNEEKYKFHNQNGQVFVNDDKLICYHFCGLRLISKDSFALIIGNQVLNTIIHTPYTLVIQENISLIEQLSPGFDGYSLEDHFRDRAILYKIGL